MKMNLNIVFPEGAFDKVNEAFDKLCEAEEAYKKAKRRALIVKTIEKAALLAVGIAIYKHFDNKNESEE